MTIPSTASLLSLPDEIIQQIFFQLPLSSLASCIETCKRLSTLSNTSLLWKHQCVTQYRYWNPEHYIKAHLKAPSAEIDWKGLLAKRKRRDITISAKFKNALPRVEGRIQTLEAVATFGYDAKDSLIHEIEIAKTREDRLAREYWARSILGTIERGVAFSEWRKMLDEEAKSSQGAPLPSTPCHLDYPLERVFGALDLFLTERPPETIDEISEHLDNIAKAVRRENPAIDEYTLRNKALAIATFLRSNGFKGVPEGRSYRDMRNHLIGVALCDKDHPSLPIILSVIYCSIARRLGLRAFVCNFPFQVICRVSTYNNRSLNDRGKLDTPTYSDNEKETVMFLNPYDNAEEVSGEFLLSQLQRLHGWPRLPAEVHKYLRPAPPSTFLQRSMANLQHTLQDMDDRDVYSQYRIPINPADASHFLPKSVKLPLEIGLDGHATTYFLSYTSLLFRADDLNYTQNGAAMISHTASQHFPVDAIIMTKELPPSLRHNPSLSPRAISHMTTAWREELHADDAVDPKPRRMVCSTHCAGITREASPGLFPGGKNPQYHVGDYFRHKRYGYYGVITGWDYACAATDTWIRQMRVDGLPRGRSQAFYKVVDERRVGRYVAEENVESVLDACGVVEAEAEEDAAAGGWAGADGEGFDAGSRGRHGRRASVGGHIIGGVIERHLEGNGPTKRLADLRHYQLRPLGDPRRRGWPEPSRELMHVAGRYFKRWDARKWRFVSNQEDWYPND